MRSTVHRPARARAGLAAFVAATLATSGCSLLGEEEPAEPGGSAAADPARVVLLAHESFALPDELVAQFEGDSGQELVIRRTGDAGTLTNRLVLTADSPTGDVAFGVDNTFASRALDNEVFAEAEVELPDGAADFALPEGGDRLFPVDVAHVCVNIDRTWFDREGLAPPETLADLTEPAYEDLLVLPGAATSSPGMAFLLTTIAAYGEDWPDYWSRLMGNGARLTAGWSDAYYVDFTQGGGEGTRPIVLSYDSSPAFTVPDGARRSTTRALLDTCFRQVEYAGVLEGAENPEGGAALVEFLLSEEVQAALPESMYVFPVRAGVPLPPAWARYAVQPESPYQVDPAEIAANRDDWLEEWTEVTTR